jgi:hypothetical protein
MQTKSSKPKGFPWGALFGLIVVFLTAAFGLFQLSKGFSIQGFFFAICFMLMFASSKGQTFQIPQSIPQAQKISSALQRYKDAHFVETIIFYSAFYIFKQTFSIPGSGILNVIGGTLFGLVPGIILVSLLTVLGVCSCYALARSVGRPLALPFFCHFRPFFCFSLVNTF